VIRRQLRHNWGYGEKLKPVIDKFPKNVLPKKIKRYLVNISRISVSYKSVFGLHNIPRFFTHDKKF
jgi:hypothetical protein